MLWIDPKTCMSSHVPVMESRVQDLKDLLCKDLAHMDTTVDIATSWNVATAKTPPPYGKMVLVSPPEAMDAILWECADRISSDTADETELKQWLRVLRSATFRFIKLDSDDAKYYYTLQQRETEMVWVRHCN